jgi:tetratricopeptide (TPR) repeat protein
MSDRVTALQRMLERNPGDARAHFGLASEYEKVGDWNSAVTHLRQYLALAEDQGNAWGRLGRALVQVGQGDDAIEAYRTGIQQAQRHGHPSMALEFEEAIEQLQQ